MNNEVEIRLRIIGFAGGGYVLADNSAEEPHVIKAVSTMDELVGAIGQAVRDWQAETQRVARAHAEDENPKIIKPRRFWPSLLQRAGGDE